MHEGSVTFLPSLAPPNSYLHSPPSLPYYLHLFITSAPLFYRTNKKSHLIILLSQSSCHAPSDSLGLGPLLGLGFMGLGFMGLSILYLVSINLILAIFAICTFKVSPNYWQIVLFFKKTNRKNIRCSGLCPFSSSGQVC